MFICFICLKFQIDNLNPVEEDEFTNLQVHLTILYKYKRKSFKVQKDRKLVKLNFLG